MTTCGPGSRQSVARATAAHVRAAVARATLCLDPGPHVVIDDVLPQSVYLRLLAAVPPVEFFTGGGDGTKLDYRVFSTAPVPTASRVIWETFESEICLLYTSPSPRDRQK